MSDVPDNGNALLSYATEVAKADDVETVYDALTDAAETIFEFSSSVVETESDGVLTVRSWSGRPPSVAGIGTDEGVAGTTFQTGEPQVVEDTLADQRVDDPPDDRTRSVVSVPIGDVGVLQIGADEPGRFDDDDVETAELLASHAFQAVERIRSRQNVRRSEARFRKLFEQADDALVLYDVGVTDSTRIQFVNDAAESLFEAAETDLRGQSIAAYFTADPDQFVVHGDDVVFETRLAADDDRILEVHAKQFLQQDGPDAFAIVSDVTDQHHRERTLTSLHDATRRMLVEDNPQEIAEFVHSAAEDLLGLPYGGVFFPDDDADELRPASVATPPDADPVPVFRPGESLAWDVYESGQPATYSDVGHQPNVHNPGTSIREEMIHPLGDHGILVVGSTEPEHFDRVDQDLVSVLATNAEAALDRAEHVRQLRIRESDLRRERNRFAALFENVPSPTASFVVEDGVPVVRSVNPAFEDVFGYDEAELAGENLDEYIIPPDRESKAEQYNQKLAACQNVHAEVRRLTDDGPRDFLLDYVPFQLDEPNRHGYAMYTDITERRERERELERQNDRLEEFASIVSHDLRNPLNVARGYLELAEQSDDDQYYERMDDALARMHDIIESVLSLARHGRSLDDTRDVALSDAAERAWRNVDTGDATLDVARDVVLDADPSRLGSLLENLFANAVEHSTTSPDSRARGDSGDVTVTVGVLDDEGDAVGFYVEDDGRGIPPERRDVVFEYGETRTEDGTGFGLAIVNSIAQAHGWAAELAESESGGARFEFYT